MKKLILMLAMMFIVSSLFAGGYCKQDQKIGTTDTSDVYVNAVSIANSNYEYLGILIYNTGSSSNDISWRVKGYVYASSDSFYVIAAATDLSDDEYIFLEEMPCIFTKIEIDMKTTTADLVSTYQIDWTIKNSY